MPRSFLIKKHFGCPLKKRPLPDPDQLAEEQSKIDDLLHVEEFSPRPSSTDSERLSSSSEKVSTPPPAVALIARQTEDSRTPLLEPLNLHAASWPKTVIPPYLPFNFSSLYPSYPSASPNTDMYHHHHHQITAGLVPPLYPVSPMQRSANLRSLSPYSTRDSPDEMRRSPKKAEPLAPLPLLDNNHHSHSNTNSDVSYLLQLWPEKPSENKDCANACGDKKRREAPRYQCSDCNKSYSTYSGLTKHQQFHCVTQAKKSFSCKYCEKVYVSLGALKMHIRTHTLPCKCKLCGKAFSRPWLLQGHIRTHTGEKPFACPHCNRAFADRSNLRAHLQTHSDVKKYSCKNCSKTFSRMSLLLKHEDGGCHGPSPHAL